MNTLYTVRLTKHDLVSLEVRDAIFLDCQIAELINKRLKEQGAPHVERCFLLHETWRTEICKIYESYSKTIDPTDGATILTFKLRDA